MSVVSKMRLFGYNNGIHLGNDKVCFETRKRNSSIGICLGHVHVRLTVLTVRLYMCPKFSQLTFSFKL